MLSDATKQQIQDAYRASLAFRGLTPRFGQKKMIAEIARYLGAIEQSEGVRTSSPRVVAVEAPTGTGKTLAYLLAAIPVAKALGKRVLVSTATVALQDQLLTKDLPDLKEGSGLNFSYGLAKGRGRYLCLARLETRLAEIAGAQAGQTPSLFVAEETTLSGDEQARMQALFMAVGEGRWDGDRDHWPGQLEDDLWRKITTDHRQCPNRRCGHFRKCAFFTARQSIENADVIVANHDLVLADLALGGGAILPDPAETIYLFDEAHQLPDKAVSHFAHGAQLQATRQWLKQQSRALSEVLPYLPPSGEFPGAVREAAESCREADAFVQGLYELAAELDPATAAVEASGDDGLRLKEGVVPAHWLPVLTDLTRLFATQVRALTKLTEGFSRNMGENAAGTIDADTAETWFPLMGAFLSRAEALYELWQSLRYESRPDEPPMARWVRNINVGDTMDLGVYSTPVLASHLLYGKLWSRCFGAVLTSATLTALGRFDRLRWRTGMPSESDCFTMPHAFDYQTNATLEVPPMKNQPGPDDAAYAEEILECLPGLLARERASLVLFTSRQQMRRIREGMPVDWQPRVMTQDDASKNEVLRLHREKIDKGEVSVLFGLASFSEGIDLPGDYLSQVVITRIPFSVPDDPVDSALSEWIQARGGDPFMQLSVADASVRLVQSCGRFLRSEKDTGRIVILDKRVVTRRYGRVLLDALPPFRRV